MYGPHEVPHITEAHFAAFGRIVHAFARVEALYEAAILAILDLKPYQAAMALSQSGYEQKRQLLIALIETSGLSDDEIKQFKKRIKSIGDKSTLRNNVAHSVWTGGRRTNAIKPFVIKTKSRLLLLGHDERERDWTSEELHNEADELLRRASTFKAFLVDLGMMPTGNPRE